MLGLRRARLLRAIVRMAPPVFLSLVLFWTGMPSPGTISYGGSQGDVGGSEVVVPGGMAAGGPLGSVLNPGGLAAVGVDDRFGINFVNSVEVNKLGSSTVALRYRQAAEAGARWTRWPLYWSDVETSPGNRNYAEQDAVIDLDLAKGLQPHIILMFSPSWAATSGDPAAPFPRVGERSFRPLVTPSGVRLSTAIAPPRNLYLAWNDPSNYWGQFVYNTVLRYKNKVKVWEMWNEPDFSIFWSGSAADYYQLLKAGYQAVKAADPQATVLFAGLSYWSTQLFLQDVLDHAASDPDGRGGGFFFDALPWHPYIDPSYIYSWAQRARSQMQATLGLTKPVWVNETGIPVCAEWATTCSSSDTWRATLDEQASFVIQAYSYAIAADVQRMSIFQLWDDGLAPADYYGLAANSGTTRPSYKAYQVAATYLSRPTGVTRSAGSGYEMIVAEGTPQGRVTVVWATGSNDVQVSIPAVSTIARLVDQNGAVTNVNPAGDYYRLTLPRATNNRDPSGRFVVGGKPYLLVEPYFNTLSSLARPLPATAPGLSFTVSWARLDNAGTQAVFDIQFKAGANGSWTNWLTGTSATSSTFGPSSPVAVQEGQTYYFRSRLKELQGAIEPWPGGDGDAHTTTPVFLTGKVMDNRGISLVGARVALSSLATISDISGNFRLAAPPGTYSAIASAEGYGTIPARSLEITRSLSYSFALPPVYNPVQNWGFDGGDDFDGWWVPSGQVSVSTWAHSGAKSARLGQAGVAGNATIGQSGITIPAGTYRPVVSFLYAVPAATGAGDTFFLDVTSSAGMTSYSVPLATQGTWAQKWFALGDVSGPISLSFRLHKASADQLEVFLDEVSVGKASGGPNVLYFPQAYK